MHPSHALGLSFFLFFICAFAGGLLLYRRSLIVRSPQPILPTSAANRGGEVIMIESPFGLAGKRLIAIMPPPAAHVLRKPVDQAVNLSSKFPVLTPFGTAGQGLHHNPDQSLAQNAGSIIACR